MRSVRRSHKILAIVFLLLLAALPARAQEPEGRSDTLATSHIVAERTVAGTSFYRINTAQISHLISPSGQADVIKYVQRLPGVSFTMEGTSAFSVRGGNMGNNHLSLDGVTLYGISHLFGLTTVTPSSVIADSEFCLGGFESGDGNLLASHIRMKSVAGDFQRPHGELSLSNLMGAAFISTPIVKEKLSAVVSARWSPLQLEYNALAKHWTGRQSEFPASIKANVYDLYGKIAWKPTDKQQLFFSWLRTVDHYAFDSAGGTSHDDLGWSNNLLLLHWHGRAGRRSALSADLSVNGFESRQVQGRGFLGGLDISSYGIQSRIQEYRANVSADIAFTDSWRATAGLTYLHTIFCPAVLRDAEYLRGARADDIRSDLASLHGQLSYEHERLTARLALRLNAFWGEAGYRCLVPEWRFKLNLHLNSWLTIEGTYDRLAQFHHSLEGIPTGITLDMIVPSGPYAAPEKADQVYVGFMGSMPKGWSFSLGGYAKRMTGLIFYADAGQFFSAGATDWRENLFIGTGRSYGLESLLRGVVGPVSGQIAYTLSKTDRKFPDLNEGVPFPFKFDRRHNLSTDIDVSIAGKSKVPQKIHAAFTYTSGSWETLQAGKYLSYFFPAGEVLNYYTHPNNYRLPDYIRLDLSYSLSIKGARTEHDITLGVYNVLNRHNAYSLTWDAESGRWKQLSILPILPSVSYVFHF